MPSDKRQAAWFDALVLGLVRSCGTGNSGVFIFGSFGRQILRRREGQAIDGRF